MIAVIWALSPYDGRHHAVAASVMADAAQKGYAEARCGHTAPPDQLVKVPTPVAPLCPYCLGIVGQELVDVGGDPGRFGRAR